MAPSICCSPSARESQAVSNDKLLLVQPGFVRSVIKHDARAEDCTVYCTVRTCYAKLGGVQVHHLQVVHCQRLSKSLNRHINVCTGRGDAAETVACRGAAGRPVTSCF